MEHANQGHLVLGTLMSLVLAGCSPEPTGPIDPVALDSRLSRVETLQARVDELLDQTDLPGLVVALAEGSQKPILAASGYADTDRRVALHPDTPFFIGSISKNVFAVIALQLVEEGRLGLDNPLSAYLEWPRGEEITIRMLMNHTSGVPDYFGALSLGGSTDGVPEFFSEPHPPADIFRLMPSQVPAFDPGSEQSYSNTNGLLVGRVIEIVTGKCLGKVLNERIVSPLGLANTYLYDETTVNRPRARGYCGMQGWVEAPGQLTDCSFADEALPDSADGSIVSTAGDLLRYHQALRGGELLSAESWAAMRHVEPGLDNGLGYLIMTGPQGDHQGNVGRAMGHLAANVYYLDTNLFVVMMLNRGDGQLPLRQFLDAWIGKP